MKKKLLAFAMIVMTFMLLLAFQPKTSVFADDPKVPSQWAALLNEECKEAFSKEGPYFPGWKDVIKGRRNLDLQEIVFGATVASEEPCPNFKNQVHVFVTLELRVLCLDSAGIKKSILITRKIVVEIDKDSKTILGGWPIEQSEWVVVDGWNDKDI